MSEPRVESSPYPYFVKDDFLHPALIRDIRRNWPGRGYFVGEIPGNYVCDLVSFQKEGFWGKFIEAIFPVLICESMGMFAEQIRARYPGETEFMAFAYGLMQSRGDYGGHDVHNHHYHDPTWVMTLLLYLDADATGHQGTTVFRAKAGMQEELAAAQTLHWEDLTEEHETVEYKTGRLFGFHDNVVGYHGVKASKNARFGRRILRLHIGADTSHCERLYGVDYATYQGLRQWPSKDEKVVGWLKRDIEQMRNPGPKLDEDAKLAWMNSLKIAMRSPKKVVGVS